MLRNAVRIVVLSNSSLRRMLNLRAAARKPMTQKAGFFWAQLIFCWHS